MYSPKTPTHKFPEIQYEADDEITTINLNSLGIYTQQATILCKYAKQTSNSHHGTRTAPETCDVANSQ